MKIWIFLFWSLSFIALNAQSYVITGTISDSLSGEPLPFVNIIGNQGGAGAISDINGTFRMTTVQKQDYLIFSYVGYTKDTVKINGNKDLRVLLRPNSFQLNEFVIIAGENPAHRIINNAVARRKENDPMQLNSFSHYSHNKFFITANTDSLRFDSINSKQLKNLSALLDTSYLFLMENISEKKFMSPSLMNENILAVKTSGMEDPLFSMIMTQMQSFSFYKNLITISDKNYVNPISKGSVNRYFFLLEDTIYEEKDSIFVISFRPARGKNFDALKGIIYIESGDWAIKSVVAEPAKEETGFSVRIKQNYNKPDGIHWFPYQQHTILSFQNLEVNGAPIYGKGVNYIYDVKINPLLKKSDFPQALVTIDDQAKYRDANYWNNHRVDSLVKKDMNTYRLIDSLGKAAHIDRGMATMKTMMNGSIPWGIFDIPIKKLFDFNDYEGFRLGLGLQTNAKVSPRFGVGAYAAWGFRDEEVKYGTEVFYKNGKLKNKRISVGFKKDVMEIAPVFPPTEGGVLNPSSFRSYFVKRMDGFHEYSIRYLSPWGRKIMLQPGISYIRYHFFDSLLFGNTENNIFIGSRVFEVANATLNVFYNPGNKTIADGNYLFSLQSQDSKPKIAVYFKQGFDPVTTKAMYTSLTGRFSIDYKTRYHGTWHLVLSGGKIWGDVPLSLRFNIPGTYRGFTVTAPETFETMRTDEFFTDAFAMGFTSYTFKKINWGKSNFHPVPEAGIRLAYGTLRSSSSMNTFCFSVPEQIYTESVLSIHNLLNMKFYSLGISAAYRMGYYSFSGYKENLSIRLTISYPL